MPAASPGGPCTGADACLHGAMFHQARAARGRRSPEGRKEGGGGRRRGSVTANATTPPPPHRCMPPPPPLTYVRPAVLRKVGGGEQRWSGAGCTVGSAGWHCEVGTVTRNAMLNRRYGWLGVVVRHMRECQLHVRWAPPRNGKIVLPHMCQKRKRSVGRPALSESSVKNVLVVVHAFARRRDMRL